jgi:hypothetical protein
VNKEKKYTQQNIIGVFSIKGITTCALIWNVVFDLWLIVCLVYLPEEVILSYDSHT